jgi:AbrB family looped-hinge helix DNA binding protein
MKPSETWNLSFTVTVDERNRIQIPKDIAKRAELKKGDLVSFVLTQITRKET